MTPAAQKAQSRGSKSRGTTRNQPPSSVSYEGLAIEIYEPELMAKVGEALVELGSEQLA